MYYAGSVVRTCGFHVSAAYYLSTIRDVFAHRFPEPKGVGIRRVAGRLQLAAVSMADSNLSAWKSTMLDSLLGVAGTPLGSKNRRFRTVTHESTGNGQPKSWFHFHPGRAMIVGWRSGGPAAFGRAETFPPRPVLNCERRPMHDLSSIIADLERHKSAIDNALAALREVGGVAIAAVPSAAPAKRRGRPPATTKKSAGMDERRQRQAEAMRAYRAAKRAGKTVAAKRAGKKATKKGGLTAAGRKALSENMKRMWAQKRLGKKSR